MDRDRFGNPVCGQSFMAGTICSDRPGHAGGHSAVCQNCKGDWINETCTCIENEGWCEFCNDPMSVSYTFEVELDDLGQVTKEQYEVCHECYDEAMGGAPQEQEPSDEDMNYVLNSLGIRTLTTDPTPPAFSSPIGETEPSRKGPA